MLSTLFIWCLERPTSWLVVGKRVLLCCLFLWKHVRVWAVAIPVSIVLIESCNALRAYNLCNGKGRIYVISMLISGAFCVICKFFCCVIPQLWFKGKLHPLFYSSIISSEQLRFLPKYAFMERRRFPSKYYGSFVKQNEGRIGVQKFCTKVGFGTVLCRYIKTR